MISIVLSTFNRAEKLPLALDTLLQAVAGAPQPCEIVIVDNRSTDGTKAVVEDYARKTSGLVRYVWEPRPGLSHGRNAGIAASRGEILAFTDDDCYVAPDWLARIVEKFDADPALALLGGRIDLHDPTDLAISVKPVGEIIEYTDPYVHMAIIYGANFAARRTLLQAIGGFDPRLGAGSRRNLASEDLEFMYRAHKSGVRVKYFPDIVVRHAHGRKTAADQTRLYKSYTRGRGALAAMYALRGDGHALRLAYWHFYTVCRAVARARSVGRTRREELVELWHFYVGALWGLERAMFESGPPRLT